MVKRHRITYLRWAQKREIITLRARRFFPMHVLISWLPEIKTFLKFFLKKLLWAPLKRVTMALAKVACRFEMD